MVSHMSWSTSPQELNKSMCKSSPNYETFIQIGISKDVVENRMTEGQLDRLADTANTHRNPFVTGKTRFVKPGTPILGNGSSTDEFQGISPAVSAANDCFY